MPSRTAKTGLILTALLAVWLLTSFATYTVWIHGADHRDFYPWWAGARLRFLEGRDLYSVETVKIMQQSLYGRLLPPERDQQGFAYPAQMLVVLFPFWFIPDKEIATAAWEGASTVLLCASLYLLNRLRGGRLPLALLVGLLLWQYPLLMLFQGQITALILFCFVLGLWSYEARRDALAGAVIAIGVLKPELSLLPWLLLLGLAARGRRWKMLLAFAVTQTALFGLSLLLAGWWLPGWIAAVRRYAAYAQSAWTPATAWQISPVLALASGAVILLALARTRWSAQTAFAASIPAGILLLPQTLLWGLTMLMIPAALCWKGRARWLVGLMWLSGWLLILAPPAWWKLHSLLLGTLALAAAALACREPLLNEITAQSEQPFPAS